MGCIALLWGLPALGSAPDALDRGDRAWGDADRATARAAWTEAAAEPDPATRAMAHLRLLLVSGTAGLVRHGPRADQALMDCPEAAPRCRLAAADRELLLAHIGLPADLPRAIDAAHAAQAALPGPALARLVWAGAAPIDALEDIERDGLGDVLLAHGGAWPTGPGTWWFGVGVTATPGVGTGAALTFVHPDVGWRAWHLQTAGGFATGRSGHLSIRLFVPADRDTSARWSAWTLAGARGPLDVWAEDRDAAAPQTRVIQETALASVTPGVHREAWSAWLGPQGRVDRVDGVVEPAPAALGGVSRTGDHLTASLVAELVFTEPAFPLATASLVGQTGPLAARVLGSAAPSEHTPLWRLPSVGGGLVLRAAPAGRWRAPWLACLALEWRPWWTPRLGSVVFAETAWAGGPHGDVGAGLRLRLPPGRQVVRLDIAFGDAGWGATAGWGHFF